MMRTDSIWSDRVVKDKSDISLTLNNGYVARGRLKVGNGVVFVKGVAYIPGTDFQGAIYESVISGQRSLVLRREVA